MLLLHVKMEKCVVYCAVSLEMEKDKWQRGSVFGILGNVISYFRESFAFFGGLG